jgi:diadenosine tetraphosphate (Ap4A) HIT family hydrolase
MSDCALCHPGGDEYARPIARLAVSTLYLKRDQRYRGACVLVHAAGHVASIDRLPTEAFDAAMRDLHRAARAVVAAVSPDHVNYLGLGNVVPHLHWHIVPRYRDDGRWGRAIGDEPEVRLPDAEAQALVEAIRRMLA